jgi:hypothetical protein
MPWNLSMVRLLLLGGPEGQLQSICHDPSPPPPKRTNHHNLVSSSFTTTNKKVQILHVQFPSTLFAKAAVLLSSVPFNMSALSSGSISLPKCYFSISKTNNKHNALLLPPRPPPPHPPTTHSLSTHEVTPSVASATGRPTKHNPAICALSQALCMQHLKQSHLFAWRL